MYQNDTYIYSVNNEDDVCVKEISFSCDKDLIVSHVQFKGGCPGNHAAISRLVEGKKADEIIKLLDGVKCGNRKSSCPDKLAKCLQKCLQNKIQIKDDL